MMRRTLLPVALAVALPFVQPVPVVAQMQRTPTRHVTHTYLAAKPGLRADLIAYIHANWFAMDRIGIDRGLFTSYTLLERRGDDAADWDVIVAVGYPTAAGHDAPGVADAFKAIRAAHKEVKINGRGLAELGAILRHHPLTVTDQNA